MKRLPKTYVFGLKIFIVNVAYGHLLFLLFLLVSTALPDVAQGEKVDLKEHYFENQRIQVVQLSLLYLL